MSANFQTQLKEEVKKLPLPPIQSRQETKNETKWGTIGLTVVYLLHDILTSKKIYDHACSYSKVTKLAKMLADTNATIDDVNNAIKDIRKEFCEANVPKNEMPKLIPKKFDQSQLVKYCNEDPFAGLPIDSNTTTTTSSTTHSSCENLNKLGNQITKKQENLTKLSKCINKQAEKCANLQKKLARNYVKTLHFTNFLILTIQAYQIAKTYKTLYSYEYSKDKKQYNIVLTDRIRSDIKEAFRTIEEQKKKFMDHFDSLIKIYTIDASNERGAGTRNTYKCYQCKEDLNANWVCCPFCEYSNNRNLLNDSLDTLKDINKIISNRIDYLQCQLNDLKIRGAKEEAKLRDVKSSNTIEGIQNALLGTHTAASTLSYWSLIPLHYKIIGGILSGGFYAAALANAHLYHVTNEQLIKLLSEMREVDEFQQQLKSFYDMFIAAKTKY